MSDTPTAEAPGLPAVAEHGDGMTGGLSLWTDPAVRGEAWTSAVKISESQLIPDEFRGKPADCIVAMDYALQLKVSPLTVLQNMQVIKGKPSLKAAFAIALANERGPFQGNIRFKVEGRGTKNLSVTAWAKMDDGEVVEAVVDMAMADMEGWTKNAKYRSMPEQMLVYRSAMFLIRRVCPGVLMGFASDDELEDVAAAPPKAAGRAVEIAGQGEKLEALRGALGGKEEAEDAEVEAPASEPVSEPVEVVDAAPSADGSLFADAPKSDPCPFCKGTGLDGEGDEAGPCEACGGSGVVA